MILLRFVCVLAIAACGRIGFDEVDDTAIRCALEPTAVTGTEYFVGPLGDDARAGTTEATAWVTFERAWSVLKPGDTLTLLDGTYRKELRPSIAGAPGAPILVRAQHDGAVVIDGENIRPACTISRVTDIDLEGVHCTNPVQTAQGGEGAVVVYIADRIRVRRVTARATGDGVFMIASASQVLLEDVAAYGGGSNTYAIGNASGVVVRRCFARWTVGIPDYAAVIYVTTADVLVENCVLTAIDGGGTIVSAVAVATADAAANNNRFIGIVTRGPFNTALVVSWSDPGGNTRMEGTSFVDVAAIDSQGGVYQRGDAALMAERLTLISTSGYAVSPNAGAMPPNEIGFTLKSSALSGTGTGMSIVVDPLVVRTDHHDNVFDGFATPYVGVVPGPNEPQLTPDWDLATYGPGAYLIRPPALLTAGEAGAAAGAEILYRTVDGVQTETPLWPWPLEDRILAEDGISVTWEAQGGLWRSPPPVACP